MESDTGSIKWLQDFLERTASIRLEAGWTQEKTASFLGVSLDRYKKYEVRTPLPHHLIPKFAGLFDRSIAFVVTGKEEARIKKPRELIYVKDNDAVAEVIVKTGTNG